MESGGEGEKGGAAEASSHIRKEDEEVSQQQQQGIAISSTSGHGETKPFIGQSSPRKPGALPAGASLAERIAALQKSSNQRSSNGRSGDRSVSSFAGNSADRSSGLPHDQQQPRSVSSGSRLPPSIGGSAAVRDRIAKFQGTERPLLPKSSFGSPSPMNSERNSNALRPYPGANATGGGSGAWGEGVLRPQMTGGTWVGGGEGRGWQSSDSNGIRPQLTGTPWTGAGVSSPSFNRYKAGSTSSNGSVPRSPMRTRDAFLDLEEDSSLLSVSPQKSKPVPRRESSFSGAQLAAASMGLSRSPQPRGNEEGGGESIGDRTPSVAGSREGNETMSNATTLAEMPEAPTEKPTAVAANALGLFPDAPSNVPVIRSPETNQTILSNDVEISIGNATPEKMEKLRRTASGSYNDSRADGGREVERVGQGRSALLSEIQARGSAMEQAPLSPARSNTGEDDGAADIGRLIISSSATDDGSAVDSPAVPAHALPTVDEKVDEVEEEEKEKEKAGAGKVNEAEAVEAEVPSASAPPLNESGAETPISIQDTVRPPVRPHRRMASNESGVIDPLAVQEMPAAHPRLPTSSSPASTKNENGEARRIRPETSTPLAKSGGGENMDELQIAAEQAAQQAKQAISAARSKSQRVKRPAPGRMMTAAEMDASDDEYEPGWASVTTVFSSSRQS